MDINTTTKFNVNDLVFIKPVLDIYISTQGEDRPFITFDLYAMLYKIVKVYVEISSDGNAKFFYDLEPYLQNPNTKTYTSTILVFETKKIEEANLYSLQEALPLINNKIDDFKNFLSNL